MLALCWVGVGNVCAPGLGNGEWGMGTGACGMGAGVGDDDGSEPDGAARPAAEQHHAGGRRGRGAAHAEASSQRCPPALPCHAMPCRAMSCHVMPCHALPCHAVLCHAVPCHAWYVELHCYARRATAADVDAMLRGVSMGSHSSQRTAHSALTHSLTHWRTPAGEQIASLDLVVTTAAYRQSHSLADTRVMLLSLSPLGQDQVTAPCSAAAAVAVSICVWLAGYGFGPESRHSIILSFLMAHE